MRCQCRARTWLVGSDPHPGAGRSRRRSRTAGGPAGVSALCSGADPRSTGSGRQAAPGASSRASGRRRSAGSSWAAHNHLSLARFRQTRRGGAGRRATAQCDPLSLPVSCYVGTACPLAAGSLSVELCPVDMGYPMGG